MEVLESELWDLDQTRKDIYLACTDVKLYIIACRLIWNRVSRTLVYFLIKDQYPFRREQLIKLWMAQGFILPPGNKRLEDIGSKY